MKRKSTPAYEAHKEATRRRQAEISAAGRDIGELPAARDPKRKRAAGKGLQVFIETYLMGLFSVRGNHWPWSETHREAMRRAEAAVFEGKLFAIAMPRGNGKTSLIKAGMLWAVLYGYRRWVCTLAATAPKAAAIIQDVQMILETNARLQADFPEVCFPIQKLERITNRQRGQTYKGQPTRMVWNADEIVLPNIPKSKAAGNIITATGFDGAGVRGQVRVTPDGHQLRPDLVFIDDPQTDESAKSVFQTAERLNLLNGAVLEMGPPGIPLAGLMTVTVIREGDLADTSLKDPRWNGVRSPMLVKFPLHIATTPADVPHNDLWDKYGALLSAGRVDEARELYAGHRCLPECEPILDKPRPCQTCPIRETCMDAEAVVSWLHRKFPDDLSPIQHALDRHIRNPGLFAAEMQQSPLSTLTTGARIMPEQLSRRVSGLPMCHVPPEATVVTAGVDVHDEILYWCVCAFEPDFTGQVIQYGTYPEQTSRWFRQSSPPRPMSREFPGQDKDGVIAAGLERLIGVMLHHEFEKHLGGSKFPVAIECMFVDRGYKPKLVNQVRRKLASPVMHASLGLPLRATNKPIAAYQRKPGWRIGDNWYQPSVKGTNEYPHVCIDTNYWKTFVHRALSVAPGTRGALTLYGTPAMAAEHESFADHVAGAEYFTEVFANGRVVCEYKPFPHRPDNHWFDTLVMATVAASMCGCKPAVERAAAPAGGSSKGKRRLRSASEIAGAA